MPIEEVKPRASGADPVLACGPGAAPGFAGAAAGAGWTISTSTEPMWIEVKRSGGADVRAAGCGAAEIRSCCTITRGCASGRLTGASIGGAAGACGRSASRAVARGVAGSTGRGAGTARDSIARPAARPVARVAGAPGGDWSSDEVQRTASRSTASTGSSGTVRGDGRGNVTLRGLSPVSVDSIVRAGCRGGAVNEKSAGRRADGGPGARSGSVARGSTANGGRELSTGATRSSVAIAVRWGGVRGSAGGDDQASPSSLRDIPARGGDGGGGDARGSSGIATGNARPTRRGGAIVDDACTARCAIRARYERSAIYVAATVASSAYRSRRAVGIARMSASDQCV